MTALAPLDYVLIALVVGSTLIGLLRGFFREAMSLVVWIGAIWVAATYAATLAPYLSELIPNSQLRLWSARAVLLLSVLVAGGIISALLAGILRSSRLDGTDRAVGMVFGFARGLLVAAAGIVALGMAGFNDEPWWRQSKLIPYASPVADALREAAERGLGRSWSPSGTSSPHLPAGWIRRS